LAFWRLWGGALLSALATFVLPFLIFLTSRGIGVREAGQVAALYGVGILVAGPVVGTLADVLNRWPTMVGSLLCAALPRSLLRPLSRARCSSWG